jgi:hypothetical protein
MFGYYPKGVFGSSYTGARILLKPRFLGPGSSRALLFGKPGKQRNIWPKRTIFYKRRSDPMLARVVAMLTQLIDRFDTDNTHNRGS